MSGDIERERAYDSVNAAIASLEPKERLTVITRTLADLLISQHRVWRERWLGAHYSVVMHYLREEERKEIRRLNG